MKFTRLLLVIAVLAAVVGGCARKEENVEPESFSFVVYPGSRYLGQLTEVTKQAHRIIKPNEPEAPPTAIYDSEDPVEKVAQFYADKYEYGQVAADATNNLSAVKPKAYFRRGRLADDVQSIAGLLPQLNLTTDVSKAQGEYKAADIEPKPNRPRVTVQRPYFDVTTSQVVDRTIIMMSR